MLRVPGSEAVTASEPAPPGAWAPLRHRAFAVLWVATVISNIGTWMHEVAAGWLMTTLTGSPLWVAAVQSAVTLPVFLLALPAGALADLVDRRRLLLAVQCALSATVALFAALVALGAMTPALLLAITAAIGVGMALTAPAWQAIVPSLVPLAALQPAVALNSLGINISRAVGPAAAGALIAGIGIWAPFALNALSFVAVIAALALWRPPPRAPAALPAPGLTEAMASGLRYAAHSPPLRATLARAVAFFAFASAYWALLPLVARERLDGGATLYGLLVGAVGLGAVAGALALPWLKRRLSADALVAAATAGTAAVLVVYALAPVAWLAVSVSLLAGGCWIAVLSSLHVSAQVALPEWVRARGLSVFVAVFFGAMSAGSLCWGQLAAIVGLPGALLAAAAGALAAIPLSWRWKLQVGAALDLAPSMHWPQPLLAEHADTARGPVLVTVAYEVAEAARSRFLALMRALAGQRRRDGAYRWALFEDAAEPGRYVEQFLVASWAEHLRQHARVSESDHALQQAIAGLLSEGASPVVTHWLAVEGKP